MCVIICCPTGKDVPEAQLDQACKNNPDGWGLATVRPPTEEGGVPRLHIAKGFEVKQAKEAWHRHDGLLRVFHARIGTSGNKDFDNLHPFATTSPSKKSRLLFHNGTLNIPQVNSAMCDSWHLAQYLRLWETDEADAMLLKYAVTQQSRFILMTTEEARFYGTGWVEKDGITYSNNTAFENVNRPRRYAGYDYCGEDADDYTFPTRQTSGGPRYRWAYYATGAINEGPVPPFHDERRSRRTRGREQWTIYPDNVWRDSTVGGTKDLNAHAEMALVAQGLDLIEAASFGVLWKPFWTYKRFLESVDAAMKQLDTLANATTEDLEDGAETAEEMAEESRINICLSLDAYLREAVRGDEFWAIKVIGCTLRQLMSETGEEFSLEDEAKMIEGHRKDLQAEEAVNKKTEEFQECECGHTKFYSHTNSVGAPVPCQFRDHEEKPCGCAGFKKKSPTIGGVLGASGLDKKDECPPIQPIVQNSAYGTDICSCGHFRGNHEAATPESQGQRGSCIVQDCTCAGFSVPALHVERCSNCSHTKVNHAGVGNAGHCKVCDAYVTKWHCFRFSGPIEQGKMFTDKCSQAGCGHLRHLHRVGVGCTECKVGFHLFGEPKTEEPTIPATTTVGFVVAG